MCSWVDRFVSLGKVVWVWVSLLRFIGKVLKLVKWIGCCVICVSVSRFSLVLKFSLVI